MNSLVTGKSTTINAIAAFQQINHGDAWRMARLGAHNRAYSEDCGYTQFDVTLGRKYRVIVKLDADDTYAVEIGQLRKPRGSSIREYQVLSQVRGIYWDVLGETIERAALEAAGGWSACASGRASRCGAGSRLENGLGVTPVWVQLPPLPLEDEAVRVRRLPAKQIEHACLRFESAIFRCNTGRPHDDTTGVRIDGSTIKQRRGGQNEPARQVPAVAQHARDTVAI
jgi:hypothetical protein